MRDNLSGETWIDVPGEAISCDGSKCRSLGKIMLMDGLEGRGA